MQQAEGGTSGSVRRAPTSVGVAIAATIMVSSCASSMDGSAAKESGEPSPQVIDVTQLDVGDYPTRPRAPLGVAGSAADGAIIEGQRMADYVIGPWEVDPALVEGGHRPVSSGDGFATSASVRITSRDSKGPEAIPWVTREQSEAISQRYTFIVGFFSNRRADGEKNLQIQNTVLRFVDEPAAAAAAAEIGAAVQKDAKVGAPVTAVTIPGHPDAVAATHRIDNSDNGVVVVPGFESPGDVRRYTAVRSAVARGPFVLTQEARSPESLDAALELVTKTIDLQKPLIDKFRATNSAELADVQIDPTGLLARTLPVTPQDLTVDPQTVAVYEPRGALHFQREPVRRSAAMTDAGVDLVANGKDIVYQARDDAAAAQMVEAFAGTAPDPTPADPITGLPGSRCLLPAGGPMANCVASASRYVVEATSTTLLDAQQLVAAQVAMLLDQ